jgi:hypothetical protein
MIVHGLAEVTGNAIWQKKALAVLQVLFVVMKL